MYEVEQKIINELENNGIEVLGVEIDNTMGKVFISVGYSCCVMDTIDTIRYVVSSHYSYNTLLLDI